MCAICDFKIGFGIGHPQLLTVAVATRKAIEAGTLHQIATALLSFTVTPDKDGSP